MGIWDLNKRLELSNKRLQDIAYTFPNALIGDKKWEGDWQGRSILAQVSLYKCGGMGSFERLENLIKHLDEYVNDFGYFGEPFDKKIAVEQQFSGNSWYLRGIAEYYKIFKDEKIYKKLESITEDLLLPSLKFYQNYPLEKRTQGGVSGSSIGIKNSWELSTDTGCAFIMLDGATAVYEITLSTALKNLIENMIEVFSKINYIESECQTHAFLTATRGILRFYKITREKKYLDLAIKNFNFYIENGMTLNYANFNWFARLNTWTEPCAVTDSLILASFLFDETKNSEYLVLLRRIYQNAFSSAERSNGGAGCDLCLSEINDHLAITGYEAEFCCTMRICEGIFEMKEATKIKENEGYIFVKYLAPQNSEKFKLDLDGDWEKIIIHIENNTNKKVVLPLNSNAEIISENTYEIVDNFLIIKEEKEIEIILKMKPKKEKHRGVDLWLLGDKILLQNKCEKIKHELSYFLDGKIYYPEVSNIDLENEEIEWQNIQII